MCIVEQLGQEQVTSDDCMYPMASAVLMVIPQNYPHASLAAHISSARRAISLHTAPRCVYESTMQKAWFNFLIPSYQLPSSERGNVCRKCQKHGCRATFDNDLVPRFEYAHPSTHMSSIGREFPPHLYIRSHNS